jgi:hypothetical protein
MHKLLIWMALAGMAQAADFSDDDLCRAIGETRVSALQPRDRLFLEQKCTCYSARCAATGSPLAKSLAASDVAKAEQVRNAAAQKSAAEESARKEAPKRRAGADAKTEPFRKAYWGCVYDRVVTNCDGQLQALQKACEATGQYQAGGYLDLEACSHTPGPDQVKTLEAEAEARATKARDAKRAVTDEKLGPQRTVFWACMADVRKLCDEERTALKRACNALGDLMESGTFEACAGQKR